MIVFSFIRRAVMQGIPLLYGSTGEIITEKSGHLNLGIPGIMYMGAIGGVIGGFFFEQTGVDFNLWYIRILAILISLFCSLLHNCHHILFAYFPYPHYTDAYHKLHKLDLYTGNHHRLRW